MRTERSMWHEGCVGRATLSNLALLGTGQRLFGQVAPFGDSAARTGAVCRVAFLAQRARCGAVPVAPRPSRVSRSFAVRALVCVCARVTTADSSASFHSELRRLIFSFLTARTTIALPLTNRADTGALSTFVFRLLGCFDVGRPSVRFSLESLPVFSPRLAVLLCVCCL